MDPTSGGRAAHHVCIAPGCRRRGPSVRFGGIVITICIEHKADFDRRWAIGFDRIGIASVDGAPAGLASVDRAPAGLAG